MTTYQSMIYAIALIFIIIAIVMVYSISMANFRSIKYFSARGYINDLINKLVGVSADKRERKCRTILNNSDLSPQQIIDLNTEVDKYIKNATTSINNSIITNLKTSNLKELRQVENLCLSLERKKRIAKMIRKVLNQEYIYILQKEKFV